MFAQQVLRAIILGNYQIKIIFILSETCTPPNFNDCDSCTSDLANHRNDYSSNNKACPCQEHYYDVGILKCSPCDITWFNITLLINN